MYRIHNSHYQSIRNGPSALYVNIDSMEMFISIKVNGHRFVRGQKWFFNRLHRILEQEL